MLRFLAELRAIIVPPVCIACRVEMAAAEEVLCAVCRRGLPWLGGPTCERCGLPDPCSPCPARRAAWSRAWAPLAHEGVARTVVRALKYDARLAIADTMAAQIAAGAPPAALGVKRAARPGDPAAAAGAVLVRAVVSRRRDPAAAARAVLVPVPADPGRRRARGFDHAERLAAALSARTGLPVAQSLRRPGRAPHQAGASRADRLAPRRLAIEATSRSPPRVVLVDDVHTTGATLDACARALLEAGARTVTAVTYTRALRR